jgi:hypothetical protein
VSRITTYQHAFVEAFPTAPEPGVLYVSVDFATTMHLCMCGCRQEVVAPLDPTDWTVQFDGRSVSLTPSIGNWSLPCQSHYFLTRGQVRWAGRWNKTQIDAGRARDTAAKERLYGQAKHASSTDLPGATRPGWLRRWWAKTRGQ